MSNPAAAVTHSCCSLPTLYYPERGADEVLARMDIRTRFVVREGAEVCLSSCF